MASLFARMTSFLFCVSFGFSSFAFGNGDLLIQRDGVRVTAKPSADSAVLVTLKKGDELSSVARRGMFWEVKIEDGRQGFVAVTAVQRQSAGNSGLSQAIRRATVDAREENDDVTSKRMRSAVMGVRGLDESKDTASAGNVEPNMALVHRMEDYYVSPKSVQSLEQRVQREVKARIEMQ